jgi:hypothetical protein
MNGKNGYGRGDGRSGGAANGSDEMCSNKSSESDSFDTGVTASANKSSASSEAPCVSNSSSSSDPYI